MFSLKQYKGNAFLFEKNYLPEYYQKKMSV